MTRKGRTDDEDSGRREWARIGLGYLNAGVEIVRIVILMIFVILMIYRS